MTAPIQEHVPDRSGAFPAPNAVHRELSVIAPAYNEADNVAPLVEAVAGALDGIAWELIYVDDDSPDGTADRVLEMARKGYPVRCIRRIGRRGLASAVVEGSLSAEGEYIAVIDADLQHDETRLPIMLDLLRRGEADVVVGSRHVDGGGLGEWSKTRQQMSAFATWCAKLVIGSTVNDPMSGFFALSRATFHACVYDLSQQGYKILLDILTSSPRPLAIAEVPYVFRNRQAGESKVDAMVLAEFLFLLVEKITRGMIPPKFVLFSLVGTLGLGLHLAVLETLKRLDFAFIPAQVLATIAAMTLNYVINNSITYRTQRLTGTRFVIGYVIFCAVCTIGAVANIGVANLVLAGYDSWPVAGIAGALMSAVFNFGAATQLVWNQKRGRRQASPAPAVVPTSAEAS